MKYMKQICILLAFSLYLGLSGDHLAIFHDSDPQPLQVLPYSVRFFTEADAELLKQKIPFSSAAELNKLLEDYTS